MKIRKSFFVLLISAAFAAAAGIFSACFFSDTVMPDGVNYELNADGESYSVQKIFSRGGNVTIEAEHNGLPVTSIGAYAFTQEVNDACAGTRTEPLYLKSLTLPSCIKSFEKDAFYGSTADEVRYGGSVADWCAIEINDYITSYSFLFGGDDTNRSALTVPQGVENIGALQFAGFAGVRGLEISDGVKQIGDGAFKNCRAIVRADLGETETIGENAFKNCSSLNELVLPENLHALGARAFENCASLTEITLPQSVTEIPDGAFSGCEKLKTVTAGNIVKLGGNAFYRCKSLTDINSAEFAVTEISAYSFAHCTNLLTFTVPAGVRKISDSAFSGCDKLVEIYNLSSLNITAGSSDNGYIALHAVYVHASSDENSKIRVVDDFVFVLSDDGADYLVRYDGAESAVTLPDGINGKVYKLKYRLFAENKAITSVQIPSAVTEIESEAFNECGSLLRVDGGDGVAVIGDLAFEKCQSLTDAFLPTSLRSLGKGAFAECRNIRSVALPDALSEAPQNAFYKCAALEALTVNRALKTVGVGAFSECRKLESINFPQGCELERISENAFRSCTSLTEINFPESLKHINIGAFDGCSKLCAVAFGDGVESIGENAFRDCAISEINLPPLLSNLACGAFKACRPDKITVAAGNAKYYVSGNCLIDKTDFTLVLGAAGAVVPDDGSVKSIAPYAFYGAKTLSLTLPSSVNAIAGNSLDGSDIKYLEIKCGSITLPDEVFSGLKNAETIILPQGITEIADRMFYGLANLKSVSLPQSVTSIGKEAFANCKSLERITVPDSVTSIGAYAFKECASLTEATLPNGLTSLPEGAFYLCEKLNSINIPANLKTIEDWALAGTYSLTKIDLPVTIGKLGFQSLTGGNTRVYYAGTLESWQAIEREYWCDGMATVYIENVTPFKERPD